MTRGFQAGPARPTDPSAITPGKSKPATDAGPSADSPADPLLQPVEKLRGVGSSRGLLLRRLGVTTLGELLEFFPRAYQHESSERAISDLRPNDIQVARGEIVGVDFITGGSRPRLEVMLSDGGAPLAVTFFNGGYLRRRIHPGLWMRVRGTVRYFRGQPGMANPKWELIEPSDAAIETGLYRPIYPATAGLTSETIARIIEQNLPAGLAAIRELFPANLLKSRNLVGRAQAYRDIHIPQGPRHALAARRRIIYDELMLMQLGLAISRRLRDQAAAAPVIRVDKLVDQRILRRFPYSMTAAQQNAVWQILRDLRTGRPMHRLLQGDVGSGKTAVAIYAMLAAVANGFQAALLAPTEILAEQHFLTLTTLLNDSSVHLELFTSRTRRGRSARGKSRSAAATTKQLPLIDGSIDPPASPGAIGAHIAIGTQALLEHDIEFANLGLVVVDEQHRLGVRQRATIRSKGLSPHYLVMTATPIPRTLALSHFADFDLSVIDELPPGRPEIRTRWLRRGEVKTAYEFVRKQVAAGRQAYVVVPQVEDTGLTEGASNVAETLKRLTAGPLTGLRLAPLHGQMAAEKRQAVMADFRAGRIDVLVATTVIEVGIDVPNATVIVIEDADRFGLSQLHQLRGRIGRGTVDSDCILISDAPTPASEARLLALVKTGSGFEIAELDLRLRGPGEFFGTRQHGLPEFKLADLAGESELLRATRYDAQAILEGDGRLVAPGHRALRDSMLQQLGRDVEWAQIG
jgi:ATP-dependent DNA helicase RecG